MKKSIFLIIILLIIEIFPLKSQGPRGKDFGFGLLLGDPLGLTIKYWTNQENALDAYLGESYFGATRIGADYLWHFDAFNSKVVKMYAGPGLTIGFGNGRYYFYNEDHDRFYYRSDEGTGFGGRVILGINIIPRRTPIEIILEAGVLVGISPAFGTAIDTGLGIRFYP
ncbi:MAG: hypothetical protein ABSG15_10435 [FCB group bacterium]|jgi:hypothetical protein